MLVQYRFPTLFKLSTKLKWFKGDLGEPQDLLTTSITIPAYSNHLAGPLYNQEETTLAATNK